MSDYPSQQQDKFVLRLPNGMRDRIKLAADNNNRSMNSEIVALLEERFPKPTPQVDQDGSELLLWVLGGADETEMRERAKIANSQFAKANRRLQIRVLDEVGAKVMKSKAVIVTTALF